MKKMKRVISVTLIFVFCFTFAVSVFATDGKDFDIINPYEKINWASVNAYKAALHTHTNASDGDDTLKASIERHAQAGFDIVATTDHGTVNYTWADSNPNNFIHSLLKMAGRTEGDLVYLGNSGAFSDGSSYTYMQDDNDDYLTLEDGRRILRVPYGIENNAVSINAHVNSWFIDYCDNSITTYKDAVKGVEKAGGVSVINHPGEYTKARYEIRSENAYNENNILYRYYINKFAKYIDENDSLIGIDINSKGDDRTRFDRILWDNLLKRFTKSGKNVFAIASSDAHQLSVIDTGYTIALLEQQTSKALKDCLLNGEFFAASHCIGNFEELKSISQALKYYYGETEIYNKVNETVNAMQEKIEGIESGKYEADSKIGITYSTLDKDGFNTADTTPEILSIAVNDNTNEITINTENALIVRWISNGKLICTQKADNSTIDLNDYEQELGNYIRAEVFGEGGIIYTQAFILNADKTAENTKVDKGFVDLGFFDFLFAEILKLYNIMIRTFSFAC